MCERAREMGRYVCEIERERERCVIERLERAV